MTLSTTKVGCALGKTMVNHLAYADELVILSPSAKGLQKLLNICSEYGEEHDIMFNNEKRSCAHPDSFASVRVTTMFFELPSSFSFSVFISIILKMPLPLFLFFFRVYLHNP